MSNRKVENQNFNTLCEFWGFHGGDDSSWGLLSCDTV